MSANPTLKRGANKLCAYGANRQATVGTIHSGTSLFLMDLQPKATDSPKKNSRTITSLIVHNFVKYPTPEDTYNIDFAIKRNL